MSEQQTSNSGEKSEGFFSKIANSVKKALGKSGQNAPNQLKMSSEGKKKNLNSGDAPQAAVAEAKVSKESPKEKEPKVSAKLTSAKMEETAAKIEEDAEKVKSVGAPPVEGESDEKVEAQVEEDYELPATYGETRITLMVRDPREAVAQWEISEHDRLRHKLAKGRHDKDTVLRVHALEPDGPLVQARSYGHFDLYFPDAETSSYNLHLDPDRRYVVEVGYLDPLGRFIGLAASAPGETPRSAPSTERASVLGPDGEPLTEEEIAAGAGDSKHIEVLKASGYIEGQEEVYHHDSTSLTRKSLVVRSPELPEEFSSGSAPSSPSGSGATSPGAWQR